MLLFLFFCVLNSSLQIVFGAPEKSYRWEKVTVDRVIDNEHFLLFDGRVVKIIGIRAPDIFDPRKNDQCYARPTFRLLKLLLEKKDIQIKQDVTRKTKEGLFPRHVKIEKGKNLAELMLDQGMARFHSESPDIQYDKNYEKAESEAIQKQKGIWEECGAQKTHRLLKKYQRRHRAFQKKYAPYFTDISVGRVKNAISGNTFELENGLRIRLLGIEAPSPFDIRSGFRCFGKEAQNYLQNLIQHKKVLLQRDQSQLNEQKELLRYAFLPQKKNGEDLFLNEKIIRDGYAHVSPSLQDKLYETTLLQAQEEIYKKPCGAWEKCIEEILKKKSTESAGLLSTEECPIKGNISGSKSNPVKTYHTPKSRWYKKVQLEQCFQTEEEALYEGFRKIQ
ncbi:thermonuclease family protein [Candidatus Gracilibacteria bacterium]|nr:thermonuclease family protein [Candidatus Gracilibacteria bacterium]